MLIIDSCALQTCSIQLIFSFFVAATTSFIKFRSSRFVLLSSVSVFRSLFGPSICRSAFLVNSTFAFFFVAARVSLAQRTMESVITLYDINLFIFDIFHDLNSSLKVKKHLLATFFLCWTVRIRKIALFIYHDVCIVPLLKKKYICIYKSPNDPCIVISQKYVSDRYRVTN